MAKPKGEKIQPFRASNGQSLAHAQTSLRTSMRDLNLNQILAKSGLLLFYLFGFSKKKKKKIFFQILKLIVKLKKD